MSFDFFSDPTAKNSIDFLVSLTVIITFGAGSIAFIYKAISGKFSRTIDEKIEPIKQSQNELVKEVKSIKEDLDRNAKNKEELDRERFRNVADSQNYIKDSIKTSIEDVGEIKKKLEAHLRESAGFIGQTNEKFHQIEKALSDFRSFMIRVESK